LNPGRRGGKPTTNRLSYGAAMLFRFLMSPCIMGSDVNLRITIQSRGTRISELLSH
jgi:hypothetical protein